MPERTIRPLTAADKSALVKTMARAFDRDPPFDYIMRNDAKRASAFRLAFGAIFDGYLPHGKSVVASDCAGGAFWCTHEQFVLPLWRELMIVPTYLRCCGFDRFSRALRAGDATKAHHPKEPHYYLFTIGVDPAAQREGLGSRILRYTLDECDRNQMPAYLEASTVENKALYLRHGFEVLSEFPIDAGGPMLTGMWRKPTSAPEE